MSSAQPAPPSQVNPTTIDDGISRAGSWQKATPSATCSALYDVHGAGAQRSDPKTSSGLVPMGVACNGSTASIAMPEIPNTDFLFTTD